MVKRKVTVLATLAILLAGLSPLAAQQSETNRATASVFGTDVDIYMDVIDFKDVELGKSFSLAGIRRDNLELGYATKLANFYLGAFFSGNIYQRGDAGYTIETETTPDIVGGEIVSETIVVRKILNDSPGVAENTIAILLGMANMGFKLSILQDQAFYTAPAGIPDSVVTTTTGSQTEVREEYTKTSRVTGTLAPVLEWGMPMAFGENTLKPRVSLGAILVTESEKYTYDETMTVDGVVPVGYSVNNQQGFINYGAIIPLLGLDMDMEMAEKENAKTGLGLEYGFSISLHPGKNGVRVLDTTNTVDVMDTTEIVMDGQQINPGFAMTNMLAPKLSYTRTLGERLSVGLNTRVEVSFQNAKYNALETSVTTTTYTHNSGNLDQNYVSVVNVHSPGDTVSSTVLTVEPSINVGFTYQVVPGKFQVNGGYAMDIPSFTNSRDRTTRSDYYERTTVTTYGDGRVEEDVVIYGEGNSIDQTREESLESTTSWGTFRGTLSFGGTFTFSPQLALDSSMVFANTTPSLFGTNGILTTNMRFMFTLKL